jgi:hypothetical protein
MYLVFLDMYIILQHLFYDENVQLTYIKLLNLLGKNLIDILK